MTVFTRENCGSLWCAQRGRDQRADAGAKPQLARPLVALNVATDSRLIFFNTQLTDGTIFATAYTHGLQYVVVRLQEKCGQQKMDRLCMTTLR